MSKLQDVTILVMTPNSEVMVMYERRNKKTQTPAFITFSTRANLDVELMIGIRTFLGIEVKPKQVQMIHQAGGLRISALRNSRKVQCATLKLTKKQYAQMN